MKAYKSIRIVENTSTEMSVSTIINKPTMSWADVVKNTPVQPEYVSTVKGLKNLPFKYYDDNNTAKLVNHHNIMRECGGGFDEGVDEGFDGECGECDGGFCDYDENYTYKLYLGCDEYEVSVYAGSESGGEWGGGEWDEGEWDEGEWDGGLDSDASDGGSYDGWR